MAGTKVKASALTKNVKSIKYLHCISDYEPHQIMQEESKILFMQHPFILTILCSIFLINRKHPSGSSRSEFLCGLLQHMFILVFISYNVQPDIRSKTFIYFWAA